MRRQTSNVWEGSVIGFHDLKLAANQKNMLKTSNLDVINCLAIKYQNHKISTYM